MNADGIGTDDTCGPETDVDVPRLLEERRRGGLR
jgi:hypothetical protein